MRRITTRNKAGSPIQIVLVGNEYFACLRNVPDLNHQYQIKSVPMLSISLASDPAVNQSCSAYLGVLVFDVNRRQKLHRLPFIEHLL
jgi:hypothetical protein